MNRDSHLILRLAHAVALLLVASTLSCAGLAPLTGSIGPKATEETTATRAVAATATRWTTKVPTAAATVTRWTTKVPTKVTTIMPAEMTDAAATSTWVPPAFAGFRLFGTELDEALRSKGASFFGQHLAPSTWNCLGDETIGVCKGQPAGTVLEGIPLTENWQSYRIVSAKEYEASWREPLEAGVPYRLHAIAVLYGDNPLIPFAAATFFAVVADEGKLNMSPAKATRVLLFEDWDHSWLLRGELHPGDEAQQWLKGDCVRCYDQWIAWP